MRPRHSALLFIAMLLAALPLFAEREPVLKQADVPHPYYWREMYIPQLTTGPSSVAWMPDSKTLVYSMAGSLWRQELGSETATELTAGPGYDYQPDVSPDGRWIIYTKYNADALELWLYDVQAKQAHALTTTGAVNVEPRFSPDGSRIVFVSTQFNRRFHIFTADFDAKAGALNNIQRLTGETRSPLPRYYYSQFDHEISPSWSPDGKEIIFISNRGHIYGTGGLWRMKADPGAFSSNDRGEMRELHYEETTWKARPDWSRDGRRVIYASYSGRQWHQLWMIWSEGGDPLPLTFGEYDNVSPRWSPDARHVAFISNREENTSLWTVDVPGAGDSQVQVRRRQYLRPMGHLLLTISGAERSSIPARVSLTGEDGRAYGGGAMHAEDGFDRKQRSFEAHYFEMPEFKEEPHDIAIRLPLDVPAGMLRIEAVFGFEYTPESRSVLIKQGQTANVTIEMQPLHRPVRFDDWVSGDVHVHMNYGGTYLNTPERLLGQAAAEDLSIVNNLVVNKEQRFPDVASQQVNNRSTGAVRTRIFSGQEYHTSYWGHIGLIGKPGLVLPGFSAYPGTAMGSLYPMNADIADLAHERGGLVGYVHPFDELPTPPNDTSLTHELPVDAALGKIDYLEVLGFSDHKSTAEIWYRLLNCGFHIPAAGGTDAMANFASLRGPVGMNRTYVEMLESNNKRKDESVRGKGGEPSLNDAPAAIWLSGLKSGHTFATNGPLLSFKLGNQGIGGQLSLPAPTPEMSAEGGAHFSLWLRSIVPVDHAQIVCNGKVAKYLPLSGDGMKLDAQGTIPITQSGWCVFRAWADHAEDPVLDNYPYATTSPIYFTVADKPTQSAEDAHFFIQWIDRLIANADANRDYNLPWEKEHVMDVLHQARKVYEAQTK